ncbi:hypothetical protein EKL30_13530 [Candidimonas sp. SYP-B2681]|uniref:hypothetical protein n=1 Tax=Candidimonas sp. SYP-B2681 TaxID=2497686 RepID=UPI000F870E97|nr:hypothetical protein [Candidimonas sp. SYP-B2681]RTZ41585.1 hypothetical protein EKL30_13530 [Candidimonas sp. SYP-B2681]
MSNDIPNPSTEDASAKPSKESWIRIMRGLPNNYEGSISLSDWFESAKKLGIDQDQAKQILEWSMDDGLISHHKEADHLLLQIKGVTLLKESTI